MHAAGHDKLIDALHASTEQHPAHMKVCWRCWNIAGKNLQAQYERWQPRAKYKMHLDPTMDDVKKLAVSSRRAAKVSITPSANLLSLGVNDLSANSRCMCKQIMCLQQGICHGNALLI